MKKYLIISLVLVSCARGPRGFDGRPGPKGDAGSSCLVTQGEDSATITCSDGSSATVTNGEDGSNGLDGLLGATGESCTVEQVENGALVTCGDSSVLILNGKHDNGNHNEQDND